MNKTIKSTAAKVNAKNSDSHVGRDVPAVALENLVSLLSATKNCDSSYVTSKQEK